MKTNSIKINRLILVLGIALVAGCVMAAATYLNLERKTHSAGVSMAAINRLYQDLQLCSALQAIPEADVSGAAWHLDLQLCNDIIAVNSQLPFMDAEDRAFIKKTFERLALLRPRYAETAADATHKLRADQIEAAKILAEASGGTLYQNKEVAVAP